MRSKRFHPVFMGVDRCRGGTDPPSAPCPSNRAADVVRPVVVVKLEDDDGARVAMALTL